MLVSLFILASLCNIANADNAVIINVCSVPVPNGQNFVQRPSVPVDNCQDRDAPACFEIFKHDVADVAVYAQNLMP